MDACTALANWIDRLAALGLSDRRFLKEVGRAGGVRRGPLWLTDAASGGSNRIRGRGFQPELDDDTDGQARHFAGSVAVAARIGGRATRWLTRTLLRDGPATADGRLTDEAIAFVEEIRSGTLRQADASAWLRRRLCGAGLVGATPAPARRR
ncbi:hypothetical protein ABIQ69_13650 [Agromyces sp. G08B096]|uniref:Uncharacterized protein n=1 Tax=Agromyces sp. G08B096 TaxID=3156399 RepID=A0AAU7W5D5_9MICO